MSIKKTLVVGGGIAGITAARMLDKAGIPVILAEKEDRLGGHMAQLVATFPELDEVEPLMAGEIAGIEKGRNIAVLTSARLVGVEGQPGNFRVSLRTPDREIVDTVGAIIVATGFNYMDPTLYTEYGYGRFANVVTSLEFEQMLKQGKLPQSKDGKPPVVVFVHCVGSRDRAKGYRYCSRICCNYSAKHATLLKKRLPKSAAYVFYIDIRSAGKGYEEFLRDAIEVYGVRYIRGRVAKVVSKGDKLIVRAEDSLVGNPVEVEADMVVLASAITPPEGSRELAKVLGIETDEYGFYKEAQANTRPACSSRPGIYLAGGCTGPVEISQAVAQAGLAVAEVLGMEEGN